MKNINNNIEIIKKYDDLNLEISSVLFLEEMTKADKDKFIILYSNDNIFYALLVYNVSDNEVSTKIAKFRKKTKQRANYKGSKVFFVTESVLKEIWNIIYSKKFDTFSDEKFLSDFDDLLKEAISMKVTDIHFTVMQRKAVIRFRKYGEMIKHNEFDANYTNHLIRVLYNAQGKEGQKDLEFNPNKLQQTIMERLINGKKYRIRFASGNIEASDFNFALDNLTESYIVALRILPSDQSSIIDLEKLGYSCAQLSALEDVAMESTGAIIFSGSTNSGKSTSLASLLSKMLVKHAGKKNIISVESPVEYTINGVSQIPIHTNSTDSDEVMKRKFNQALSQLMRLDPDIMYCNEIRNQDTAKFAQDSVQTGHLFLSTIHAQSVHQIINRLNMLGVDREILCAFGFMILMIQQTLIALVCQHCAFQYNNDQVQKNHSLCDRLKQFITLHHLDISRLENIKFRNPKGCHQCNDLGIKGITVIAEMIKPNITFLQAIYDHKYVDAINIWRDMNGITMKEHALSKMLQGNICPSSVEICVGKVNLNEMLVDDEHFYSKAFFTP